MAKPCQNKTSSANSQMWHIDKKKNKGSDVNVPTATTMIPMCKDFELEKEREREKQSANILIKSKIEWKHNTCINIKFQLTK